MGKKFYLEDLSPNLQKAVLRVELDLNSQTDRLTTPEIQVRQFFPKDFKDIPQFNSSIGAEAEYILRENSIGEKEYKFDFLIFV